MRFCGNTVGRSFANQVDVVEMAGGDDLAGIVIGHGKCILNTMRYVSIGTYKSATVVSKNNFHKNLLTSGMLK